MPSQFLLADSQTIYLLLAMSMVTCVYFYNNYQNKLFGDMHINKVEVNNNMNNMLSGSPISDDPEVIQTLKSKDYQRTVNPLLPPERSYQFGNLI